MMDFRDVAEQSVQRQSVVMHAKGGGGGGGGKGGKGDAKGGAPAMDVSQIEKATLKDTVSRIETLLDLDWRSADQALSLKHRTVQTISLGPASQDSFRLAQDMSGPYTEVVSEHQCTTMAWSVCRHT